MKRISPMRASQTLGSPEPSKSTSKPSVSGSARAKENSRGGPQTLISSARSPS